LLTPLNAAGSVGVHGRQFSPIRDVTTQLRYQLQCIEVLHQLTTGLARLSQKYGPPLAIVASLRRMYGWSKPEVSGAVSCALSADMPTGSLETAITYARSMTLNSMPVRQPSRGRLSPREREITHLVAQGLSNREIADQLVIPIEPWSVT
jgi:DNA-binding NarL/FixJ family response regulator